MQNRAEGRQKTVAKGRFMEVVAHILVVLVALEFFYIAYLEICATSSETSSKVFDMPKSELSLRLFS
jgi:uncharacterized membrane protein